MKQNKKRPQKSKRRDKHKLFISIVAGFMVLCMLIPIVSMALTAGLG